MNNSNLDKICYINFPPSFSTQLGSVKVDSNKKLPFLIPDGKEKLEKEDYSVESLMAGLITVIAYDTKNENTDYYKSLCLELDKDIVKKLNAAAIAKEQRNEYDFAEGLFLSVYHLLPQSASCINLATLYSYMAVDAKKKDEDDKKWIKKARETLLDGLERFGENEDILAELSSFEAFMANLDEAKEYLDRYLSVAKEGEKKEEMKKLYKEVSFKLDNEESIEEAYDFISMGEPDKALKKIDGFIENNPKVWNGYFLKGWALRVKKEFEEAKDYFLKCIKLGESNAEIYNELALCELGSGKRELAEAYLETACDLDDENLTTTTNLALLYLEDENYDRAREFLEKARFLAKEDKLVSHLIKKYEEKTGEKIGALIHEELVKGTETSDGEDLATSFFNKMADTNIENKEECNCGGNCNCNKGE